MTGSGLGKGPLGAVVKNLSCNWPMLLKLLDSLTDLRKCEDMKTGKNREYSRPSGMF